MIIVTYAPAADHPDGGPIICQVKGSPERLARLSQPFVEVLEDRQDWDATHFVLAGVVTPIPAEIVEARNLAMAGVRLRVRRDGILRDVVDPILSNPVRWAALSLEQQAVLGEYRDALLAWPTSEPDPLNPTPPPAPDFV